MASDDEGQIILLAGVLLVLGFILFSIQLNVLTNLGAQVGRETVNPMLEDYFLVRRSIEAAISDEIKDTRTSSSSPCPDLLDLGLKVKTVLGTLSAEEANRGQSMHWTALSTTTAAGGFKVTVTLILSDATTSVRETIDFVATCTGAPHIPTSCTANVCVIK